MGNLPFEVWSFRQNICLKGFVMRHILILLLLSISFHLFAQPPQQITVKGTAVDSASRKPLGFATLILRNAQSAAPVKSMLTKDDGTFEFTAPSRGKYKLDLAYVGYRSKSVAIATHS